ncbi:hypothetical protein ACHWQZ_G011623 [Mnemiopsis leidyi]
MFKSRGSLKLLAQISQQVLLPSQLNRMVSQVPDSIFFPKEEENVLELWKKNDTFKKSLEQSKAAKRPNYTFYDGPPFATGLPHYGHLLAGSVKDIVTRYAHQNGYHVERRFGWDCHGLPVEHEIDKKLGITGPADVHAMGIDKYNAECRSIVMRYANEWEHSVERLGRWIDFKNDYKTLYPWFMESVWWVWSQLFAKGLVYRGYKVMPYSTACNTPLSNFEVNQNYHDVTDPAVFVNFPIDQDSGVSFVAWTTTPWTLPSNLALCANPDETYVKILDKARNQKFIMMEARLCGLYKGEDEYEILDKFLGNTLAGKTYTPLFPYMEHMKPSGAFKVCLDKYVTRDAGTGIVHQAPAFGEDDYRVCLTNGVFKKGQEPDICPVDPTGKFLSIVADFSGMYVKDADKHIIKKLKEGGRMVHAGTMNHSYPYCWRSDTPLIYRVVPSWFIKVTSLREKLLANNDKCYWVPEFVKEKRFKNWLADCRDWSVSRNRYWGTPIPLWMSDDGQEVVCVGSIKELEELTGQKITDIHRESIDHLTIPSKCGKGELKRVSEVFDCWFESGSMPYAQQHYPFENVPQFDAKFPAEFIAEGVDQTRGWFYTLLVLATALFDKPPYKNLIVTGLVLAADGKKMSKRLKNYPDPTEVMNKYGADALRLYMIDSPVVRADTLRFKEEGVKDVLKDVLLPWFNAYRFLVQNIIRLDKEDGVKFLYNENSPVQSNNVMDKWILSYTHSLIDFVKVEMAAYRLYTVVPRLLQFIANLTNWYVRLNRARLRGEVDLEECQASVQTLFSVLFTMIRLMAPFTPFITEMMYQNLYQSIDRSMLKGASDSIHYLMLPKYEPAMVDQDIERRVSVMQSVIETGRVLRDRNTIPIKYPLKEVVLVDADPATLSDAKSLESYIVSEMNVKKLTVSSDKQKYDVKLTAKPNHMILGKRLKKDFKAVSAAIVKLTDVELSEMKEAGHREILGHDIGYDELHVSYEVKSESGSYAAASMHNVLVLLDCTLDQEMFDEGLAREVINRIQKLRKKAKLVPTDKISIFHKIDSTKKDGSEDLARSVRNYQDLIETGVKSPFSGEPAQDNVIISEEVEVKGCKFLLTLCGDVKKSSSGPVVQWPGGRPAGEYFTVVYNGSSREVLLQSNGHRLTAMRLENEVKAMFGLFGRTVSLSLDDSPIKCSTRDLDFLAGSTVTVTA